MLVSMKEMLNKAKAEGYAVGYFEAWNMDSLLAVKDAAEAKNSPVIIGFGGTFLFNDVRKVKENIKHYGALGKSVAENSPVPMAFILNETADIDELKKAIPAGFNTVMYMEDMKKQSTIEHLLKVNKELVETAHAQGGCVECELGELPMADISTGKMTQGAKTDVAQAVDFVKQTGIDALAVACGNVHLLENKMARLDLGHLRKLLDAIDIPIVLHGGTGIDREDLQKAIKMGVSKINVGTMMKRIYINTMKQLLSDPAIGRTDPHEVIGFGGDKDIMAKSRAAVADFVMDYMDIIGSTGRALNG